MSDIEASRIRPFSSSWENEAAQNRQTLEQVLSVQCEPQTEISEPQYMRDRLSKLLYAQSAYIGEDVEEYIACEESGVEQITIRAAKAGEVVARKALSD